MDGGTFLHVILMLFKILTELNIPDDQIFYP